MPAGTQNIPLFGLHLGLAWILALFVAFSLGPNPALAGKPAALALDVSGTTKPAIDPFSELETKTPIELAPDATIEFLHYRSCKAITVQGGRLNFSSERYLFKGGKILETKRAECPKTVALSGASKIGGIVVRGGSGNKKKAVTGTTRPSFVLVGTDADGYAAIRISRQGNTILDAKLHRRSFIYPDAAPTLEKGEFYNVTLTPAGGGKPRSFTLKPRGKPKKYTPTLIRVD